MNNVNYFKPVPKFMSHKAILLPVPKKSSAVALRLTTLSRIISLSLKMTCQVAENSGQESD